MTHATTAPYRRTVPAVCLRAYDFNATKGDGRTLEGVVAVYNSRARIRAQGGDFDEELLSGSMARSLAKRTPVMQWEHGLDPRVGRVPIAAIADIDDDGKRVHVRAELYDNPVVEPIRQAIKGGSVKGMSFRFEVPDGGDTWTKPSRREDRGEVDLRRIADMDVAEMGPVVFPAYDATSVSVRSLLAHFDPDERAALVRELAAEVRLAVDLEDLTGRHGTRSAGGGDEQEEESDDDEDLEESEELDEDDTEPPALQTSRQRLDQGALRVRGILR
jgi:HK97 family phage prohead protease